MTDITSIDTPTTDEIVASIIGADDVNAAMTDFVMSATAAGTDADTVRLVVKLVTDAQVAVAVSAVTTTSRRNQPESETDAYQRRFGAGLVTLAHIIGNRPDGVTVPAAWLALVDGFTPNDQHVNLAATAISRFYARRTTSNGGTRVRNTVDRGTPEIGTVYINGSDRCTVGAGDTDDTRTFVTTSASADGGATYGSLSAAAGHVKAARAGQPYGKRFSTNGPDFWTVAS